MNNKESDELKELTNRRFSAMDEYLKCFKETQAQKRRNETEKERRERNKERWQKAGVIISVICTAATILYYLYSLWRVE